MIVPDASVVVELLKNGPLADSLRRDLAGCSDSFVVPHLLDVEVMSALRSLVAGQRVDFHRGEQFDDWVGLDCGAAFFRKLYLPCMTRI